MADPLITRAQLENRLGRDVVAQIYDDNNDGVADTNPVAQLLDDATSKVRGALGPWYDRATTTSADTATATELRRITLDAAVAMAAQRHSGYIRQNWRELMAQVDSDLKMIQSGRSNLGADPPPDPKMQGAAQCFTSGTRGW